jgi:hypothetical protein
MIIGISGKARSGKDTIGEHLIDRHDFQRAAFADKLKDVTAVMFEWPPGSFRGEAKEQIDVFWGMSPRQTLQLMGTEAGRRVFGHDIWIKHVKLKMLSYPEQRDWVITDVRFPDEAQAICTWGGVIWQVRRPDLEPVGIAGHASETAMDDWREWDATILNYGTIAELRAKVDDLV